MSHSLPCCQILSSSNGSPGKVCGCMAEYLRPIKYASPYDVLFLLLVGQLQLAALSDAHPCWRAGVLLLPRSCRAGRADLQMHCKVFEQQRNSRTCCSASHTVRCSTGRYTCLCVLSRRDIAQGLARGRVCPGLKAVLNVLHVNALGAPLGRGGALLHGHAGGLAGGPHARLASLQPLQRLLHMSRACLIWCPMGCSHE